MSEWVRIPVAPDYEISESGDVRRIGARQALKPCVLKRGSYLAVSLWTRGRGKTWPVHQLVALSFHGPRPSPRHHAAHRDGIKPNVHRDNIRWATKEENEADKVRHGKSNRGERCGAAKLTVEQVLQIRAAAIGRTRGTIARLAEQYGLSPTAIYNIVIRRNWAHV